MVYFQNGYFHKTPEPPKATTNEDSAHWANLINNYNETLQAKQQRRYVRDFIRSSLHRLRAGEAVDIGYNLDDLILHLESLFISGMSWANYGEWEIDHILPIQWFLDNGLPDLKVVNSLDNLRPLWARENRSKGATFTHPDYTPREFYDLLCRSVT